MFREFKASSNAEARHGNYSMKKFIAIILVLIAFQYQEEIRLLTDPSQQHVSGQVSAQASTHGAPVVLYATSWCGYCEKAREFLNEKNIAYVEYDIEKSSEGKRQYDRLGVNGVPVLLVKGETVRGFNPNKILNILNEKNN